MKTFKLCILCLFLFYGCDEITNSNNDDSNDDNVTITITSSGGSTDGTSWQRGYVTNKGTKTIKNVRVNAWTDKESVTVSTSPNVFSSGQKGYYYTGNLQGKGIKTNVLYDY